MYKAKVIKLNLNLDTVEQFEELVDKLNKIVNNRNLLNIIYLRNLFRSLMCLVRTMHIHVYNHTNARQEREDMITSYKVFKMSQNFQMRFLLGIRFLFHKLHDRVVTLSKKLLSTSVPLYRGLGVKGL